MEDPENKRERTNPGRNVDLDYFAFASSKFLNELLREVLKDYSLSDQALILFSILELNSRGEELDSGAYQAISARFKPDYAFEGLHRGQWRKVSVGDVTAKNPKA
jgi:hypothetical protein